MKRLGIFSALGAPKLQFEAAYQIHLLREVRAHVSELIVVSHITRDDDAFAEVSKIADRIINPEVPALRSTMEGHKMALDALGRSGLGAFDEVLMFDATNYGPVVDLGELFARMGEVDCDFWSVNHYRPLKDNRIDEGFTAEVLPKIDFCLFRRSAIDRPEFARAWADISPQPDYFRNMVKNELTLMHRLVVAGLTPGFAIDPDLMKTMEPGMTEVIPMLEAGSPLVAKNSFMLDPIVSEMQALDGRMVLDWLTTRTAYDTGLIWDSIIDKYPLRQIHTNLEEIRVIDDGPLPAEKESWSFGKIAVMA
ncbi:MAG: rhamnan synthesis F family protein, partial [Pseudomonadota bacterium]